MSLDSSSTVKSSTTQDISLVGIYWEKCILCQDITTEALQCPAKSKRGDTGTGYKTLCHDLREFLKFQQSPAYLSPSVVESNGLETILKDHNASWHKSCRVKWNKTKINRAVKRQYANECQEADLSAKRTRLSDPAKHDMKRSICFFCDNESSEDSLHLMSTYQIDHKIR